MANYYIKLPPTGAGGVTSLNTLTGDVTLLAGTNITLTPSGQNITIASSAAGLGTLLVGNNNITGTYNGILIVTGDATVTGDLTVVGDLIAANIINTGGHAISVNGNLYTQDINCTTTGATDAQGNIFVGGNIICESFEMKGNHTKFPQISITGNFITNSGGSSIVDISGKADGFGVGLVVFGDMTCGTLKANGGDSDGADFPGYGSTIRVHGNLTVTDGDLSLWGGSVGAAGMAGGHGGSLFIGGNLTAGNVYAYGGAATNNSSGSIGGNLTCAGDAAFALFDAHGGACNSTDGGSHSGSGGSLTCTGNVVTHGEIDLSAGERTGVIASGSGADRADGGTLTVEGNVVAHEIFCNAGFVNSANCDQHGGNGGNITIGGTLECFSAGLNGASTETESSVGGNAGTITVNGQANIKSGLSIRGGGVVNGQDGSCGTAFFPAGGVIGTIDCTDGLEGTPPATTGIGIFFAGSLHIAALSMTDRDAIHVQLYNVAGAAPPGVLNIDSFGPKVKFNEPDGSQSGDVSSHIGAALFFCDVTTGWHYVTGTAI